MLAGTTTSTSFSLHIGACISLRPWLLRMHWQDCVLEMTAAFKKAEQLYNNFHGCSYHENVANVLSSATLKMKDHAKVWLRPSTQFSNHGGPRICNFHQWLIAEVLVWNEPASITPADNAALLFGIVSSEMGAKIQPQISHAIKKRSTLCIHMHHSYCSQICRPSRDPMLTVGWTILASHVTVGSHMLIVSLWP